MDKSRLGRCYELAAGRALELAEDSDGIVDVRLVHGTIQRDPHPPNPHAWLEYTIPSTRIVKDGVTYFWGRMAWEPASESVLPLDAFYRMFNAEAKFSYDREMVSQRLLQTKNYGPWDGDYWHLGDKTKHGREVTPNGR